MSEVFGGRERVTLCIDQLMPEAVVNLVGFAKCSKLVAQELAAAKALEAGRRPYYSTIFKP